MSELKTTDAANYWEAQYGKAVELNFKQAETIKRLTAQIEEDADHHDRVQLIDYEQQWIDEQRSSPDSQCSYTFWLEQKLERLTEAAQAVVDAGIIPYFPMGDYYYSESDSGLMTALAKALDQTP
jgi:hypothetical protein